MYPLSTQCCRLCSAYDRRGKDARRSGEGYALAPPPTSRHRRRRLDLRDLTLVVIRLCANEIVRYLARMLLSRENPYGCRRQHAPLLEEATTIHGVDPSFFAAARAAYAANSVPNGCDNSGLSSRRTLLLGSGPGHCSDRSFIVVRAQSKRIHFAAPTFGRDLQKSTSP